MRDPLHVLVAGWEAPTVTAASIRDARLGIFLDALADDGVIVRPWSDVRLIVPEDTLGDPAEAARRGALAIGGDDVRWADVVLLRAADLAVAVCDACDAVAFESSDAAAHARATGHEIRPSPSAPVRWLLDAIDANPRLLRNRSLAFDSDDGLRSLGRDGVLAAEAVRRAAGMADMTLCATTASASTLRALGCTPRLLRCAVDATWVTPAGGGAGSGPVRGAAFGDAARLRSVLRTAPGELSGPVTWLTHAGASFEGVQSTEPGVAIDEMARTVAALGAGAGMAIPSTREPGTELPWLLFTLAGTPTVAAAGNGGPFDVVRDGRDGLLAETPDEWRTQLKRLCSSTDLRAELAGRARERAVADYDLGERAGEWSEALHWAAEHAGVGRRNGSPRSSGAPDGTANLVHRRLMRRRALEAAAALDRLRGGRDVCWPETMSDEPLVSVVIPTYDRGSILTERSLASVLGQTYQRIEVVVVGDHATPETLAAIASVRDPRVRFENLPERSPYQPDPFLRWLQVGSRPFNRAVQLALGDFIAPNADDDEFTPDHVELLLAVALEHRLELVYGDSLMEFPDGTWRRLGEWPPREGGLCGGAVLYAGALRFLEMDEACWRDVEPNDWGLYRRMLEAGVRAGHVPEIVFRHYREGREWHSGTVGAEPAAAATRQGG